MFDNLLKNLTAAKINPWVITAVLCCVYSYVLCADVPCKITDNKCLEKLTSEIFSKIPYSKIINGDAELGIENLDPIHHDLIEGKLSILKYNFHDSLTSGLKDCEFLHDKYKWNAEVLSLHFDIICQKVAMKGKYDVNGRLIILPVEGNGDFTMTANKYEISVDTEQKIASGKDGKLYLSVKNFKQTSEPLGSIKFDFKNLFNGQKDLADAVLKFANENWYEVAKEVQDPVFNANVKKFINNFNKYLKLIPLYDLVKL